MSTFAVGAIVGLVVAPALPARALMIAMPLCGGGVRYLELHHKGPDAPRGACHAVCAAWRSDDDDPGGDGPGS